MALSTIPTRALSEQGINFRNLIINGDMSIAQRGTSSTGITSAGYYTVDRYRLGISNLGTWTISQSTDVPTGQGFVKSLKMDCTTAVSSPPSGDECAINIRLEGQNLQSIKKGTSNAESLTLSFWVRSAITGTFIAELDDRDNTRSCSQSYTISTADTWEKKTLTFPADTTGTFDNDNARSLQLNFWLGAGSDFTSGTLATAWESRTSANRAVGQVNLAGSTSNEWYITGVQLEVGTSASDFEFLPHDVNLQRCQRYFQVFGSTGGFEGITTGLAGSSTTNWCQLTYVNTMRTSPSISFTNLVITDRTSADHNVTSIDNVHSGLSSLAMRCVTASGFSARDAVALTAKNTGSGYLRLDSEL